MLRIPFMPPSVNPLFQKGGGGILGCRNSPLCICKVKSVAIIGNVGEVATDGFFTSMYLDIFATDGFFMSMYLDIFVLRE